MPDWEEVEVGDEIWPLIKVATTQMLVKWAGASGDFNPLHYDPSFAEAAGVSKPIIQGALKRQWLIQMVTDWMGEEGTLKKFSCRYKAVDYPRSMKTMTEPEEGEMWVCRGEITRKYIEDDEHLVDCRLHIEHGNAEITTTGKATVILPSRAD